MSQDERTTIIQRIHASPHMAVLAVTGGGSGAVSALLETPGASGTVLAAYVPYSRVALEDFLEDWENPHPCDDATARRMAMRAYSIAYDLGDPDVPVHGVACTASLASDREKRGGHRIHVAAQSQQRTALYSLELEKGARDRAAEEAVAASMVLDALSEATAGRPDLTAPLLRSGETIARTVQVAPPEWPPLGPAVAWRYGMPQSGRPSSAPPKVVFPGAFNPLHEGHLRMADVAQRVTGEPAVFELSVENVDKQPLDFIEVARRVDQFGDRPHLVTRAPTFTDKASLMPGCTFVVGADTLIRVADPEYYDEDEAARDAAVEELATAGCRFLVFGRVIGGRFVGPDDLNLPAALERLCDGVPESEFREDVSSTEIREGQDES